MHKGTELLKRLERRAGRGFLHPTVVAGCEKATLLKQVHRADYQLLWTSAPSGIR